MGLFDTCVVVLLLQSLLLALLGLSHPLHLHTLRLAAHSHHFHIPPTVRILVTTFELDGTR